MSILLLISSKKGVGLTPPLAIDIDQMLLLLSRISLQAKYVMCY